LQRDSLYLLDIVDAANAIAEFLKGVSEAEFGASDLIRSAVLQKLIVIGEAAANVSEPIRLAHADVPWRQIVAFRNLAVHRYFRVDESIVWSTANADVPQLRMQIRAILESIGNGDKDS